MNKLIIRASKEIEAANDLASLDSVRVKYLGKKSELVAELKKLGQLKPEERSRVGAAINKLKQELQDLIIERRSSLENLLLEKKLAEDSVDVSLSGRGPAVGSRHPVSKVQSRIEKIFINAGLKCL